jgi:nucleotide-binding universal stress UspA family protein
MRQILVIANETVESDVLRNVLPQSARALIVAPALNSRLRHWVSDEDEARAAAEERLGRCLARLRADGVAAAGAVGDADPMQAIEDALHAFDADAIVIATHPPARSHWLARDLVTRARRRFDRPVVHVVVDSARRREYVLEEAA